MNEIYLRNLNMASARLIAGFLFVPLLGSLLVSSLFSSRNFPLNDIGLIEFETSGTKVNHIQVVVATMNARGRGDVFERPAE